MEEGSEEEDTDEDYDGEEEDESRGLGGTGRGGRPRKVPERLRDGVADAGDSKRQKSNAGIATGVRPAGGIGAKLALVASQAVDAAVARRGPAAAHKPSAAAKAAGLVLIAEVGQGVGGGAKGKQVRGQPQPRAVRGAGGH
ncbi:hypothetical protein HXX76_001812 [Chlamydomonas incerta]|nr:hypothetical protein HXX76_001812 [Chlamydomonas incerta]|eukprot:KAG2443455.1 hypothetical protein HXX76_001812 [Chlamydomonas incerta]